MSQPDQPTGPASPMSPAPLDYGIPPGQFNFGDFLAFKTMIAIPVIMVLFWVGVVMAVIAGIVQMFSGHGFGGFCAGVATIIFGPFFVRIYCEFLIVVFRINETLTEILSTLRGRPRL